MGSIDMSQGAMPPPPGVEADVDGPGKGLQDVVIIVYAISTFLSTVTIILRVYTRAVIVKALGLDDLFAVLAYLLCVAYFCIIILTFQYGFAKHLWDVSLRSLQGYLTMLIPTAAIYVWIPALVKFSLLVLYHRIDTHKWTRLCVYIIAMVVFGYSLATTLIVSTTCNPLRVSASGCLAIMGLWQASLNIVTDGFMILLPLPMLYRLQLPIKQKIFLGILFSLGSAVVFASIARIIYMQKLVGNPDVTFTQAGAYICSGVEVNIGVVCCSLVVMKPFAQRHLPRLVSLSSKKNRSRSRSRSHGIFKVFGKRTEEKSYELSSSDGHGFTQYGGDAKDFQSTIRSDFGTRTEEEKESVGRRGEGDGESTKYIIARGDEHC
ncbi:hypothetical protein EJ04DRAFT_510010 [Polyplosphaeria fusca]|uniref:Rhodopsin domain-containing protein n=1 Tax=Polyplosphaeria fusca TaxID=682080 RepID=A0A9P4V617_9PLEO|nr:hypothetical protein EJ04DRAFT_510010 [Polyplosphaeria fusca]